MTVDSALRGAASAVRAKSGPLPPSPRASAWLTGGVLGLLLGALFWGRLVELYANWQDDPNYSHGFLVPLVSGYLAYRIYRRQGAPEQGNGTVGVCWVVVGCLLHLLAELLWWPPIDFLALTTILFGLAVAVGGRAWAGGFVFPIFFLFFMFPLPITLVDQMAVWLQDTVTGLATQVLNLFIPTFRAGNFIHAAGQDSLEVGEACSGLRQLVAFAALACLLVHLVGRSLVYRLLLVLAAPVVAFASNLLRVLLMCLIVRFFGKSWIGGVYHDLWGLLAMLLGLGLYLGLAWWLTRLLPEDPKPSDQPRDTTDETTRAAPRSPLDRDRSIVSAGLVRRLGGAGLCLALALGGQAALRAHLHNGQLAPPPVLEPGTLARVPVSLGAWSEAQHLATLPPSTSLDPETRARLLQAVESLSNLSRFTKDYFDRADDKSYRLYLHTGESHAQPLTARLWMVHFKTGEDRNHHPRVCYRISGMTEDTAAQAMVAVPGEKVPLQRFCFTGKTGRSYVYYWHYTLEPEVGPDLSALQLLYLKRVQRMPSVTVEVFTNALAPADLDKVDDFCRAVHREMRQQLPAHTRLGSDILNIRLVETGDPPQG
jgi:exosortase